MSAGARFLEARDYLLTHRDQFDLAAASFPGPGWIASIGLWITSTRWPQTTHDLRSSSLRKTARKPNAPLRNSPAGPTRPPTSCARSAFNAAITSW